MPFGAGLPGIGNPVRTATVPTNTRHIVRVPSVFTKTAAPVSNRNDTPGLPGHNGEQ